MLPFTLALALACLVWTTPAHAQDPAPRSLGRILTKTFSYLPSRVVDALDPFRVRVRIGSGTAASARAGDRFDYFAGSYSGFYVGLPGPRISYPGRLRPPLGPEARASTASAPADVASGPDRGPDYSPTEYAAGFQLYILGLEVGLDPYEIADWIVGFAAIDLRGDDISLQTGY